MSAKGTRGAAAGHGEPVSIRAGRWTVPVSRPAKVLFPRDGITKLDLAEHYARVAPLMLPLVRGRPVAMERFPDGLDGPRFYHKNVRSVPDWVRTETVGKKGGELTQVVCDNAATLVWMADQASITPHLWLSRTDRPQHPDQLIFDLDPPEGRFAEARRVALEVRDLLEELGLPAYPKTTGGKGLHVMVPLDRRADYGRVREFAGGVGELLVKGDPKRLTMEFRKAKREGRLFVDLGRNAYSQHAVAPYAVRARDGAPVATPLHWSEVQDKGLRPERFTIRAVARRVESGENPWGAPRARSLKRPSQLLERME